MIEVFTTRDEYAIIIPPGDVAQLGERDNRTVEVRGSSPLISTRSPSVSYLANRKHLWYSIRNTVMR